MTQAQVVESKGCWLLETSASAEALKRAWSIRALELFKSTYNHGDLFTGEMLRMQLKLLGLHEPSHPNAWGALTMALVKRGLIENTKARKASTQTAAKGRWIVIWRVK